VPAIESAGYLPFSSKCQTKTNDSRPGESVVDFRLRGVLSFPNDEREGASLSIVVRPSHKWRYLRVAVANQHKALTGTDR
jgi:hypothetical protein